jgi:hypothetical protein
MFTEDELKLFALGKAHFCAAAAAREVAKDKWPHWSMEKREAYLKMVRCFFRQNGCHPLLYARGITMEARADLAVDYSAAKATRKLTKQENFVIKAADVRHFFATTVGRFLASVEERDEDETIAEVKKLYNKFELTPYKAMRGHTLDAAALLARHFARAKAAA